MSDNSKRVILKMSDTAEGNRVHKERSFDLPMRLLIVGKSQLSGKTNMIGNVILRPFGPEDREGRDLFYRNDFRPENIYIVCPSTNLDSKWMTMIESRGIPMDNVYGDYNEEELEQLYEGIERRHKERVQYGEPAEHTLLILDDLAFSGKLRDKLHGTLSRIFCNGRHCLLSVIATMQKYSQCSTTARENATGILLYECSNKQLDLVMEDVCQIPKKDFIKMFRECTKEPHTFFVVNYSNPYDKRYMDCNFNPIPIT